MPFSRCSWCISTEKTRPSHGEKAECVGQNTTCTATPLGRSQRNPTPHLHPAHPVRGQVNISLPAFQPVTRNLQPPNLTPNGDVAARARRECRVRRAEHHLLDNSRIMCICVCVCVCVCVCACVCASSHSENAECVGQNTT